MNERNHRFLGVSGTSEKKYCKFCLGIETFNNGRCSGCEYTRESEKKCLGNFHYFPTID